MISDSPSSQCFTVSCCSPIVRTVVRTRVTRAGFDLNKAVLADRIESDQISILNGISSPNFFRRQKDFFSVLSRNFSSHL